MLPAARARECGPRFRGRIRAYLVGVRTWTLRSATLQAAAPRPGRSRGRWLGRRHGTCCSACGSKVGTTVGTTRENSRSAEISASRQVFEITRLSRSEPNEHYFEPDLGMAAGARQAAEDPRGGGGILLGGRLLRPSRRSLPTPEGEWNRGRWGRRPRPRGWWRGAGG